jgi:hypothetical protein
MYLYQCLNILILRRCYCVNIGNDPKASVAYYPCFFSTHKFHRRFVSLTSMGESDDNIGTVGLSEIYYGTAPMSTFCEYQQMRSLALLSRRHYLVGITNELLRQWKPSQRVVHPQIRPRASSHRLVCECMAFSINLLEKILRCN